MDQIGVDLLLCILSELSAEHRPSIFSATLVCKQWHAAAQRIIDGRIEALVISPGREVRNSKLFKRMQNDTEFRRRLHHICVEEVYGSGLVPEMMFIPNHPVFRGRDVGEYGYLDSRSDATWAQLQKLADLIPGVSLSSFGWAATPRMPSCLLSALRKLPNCTVHIYRRTSGSPFAKGITSNSLETATSLSSLQRLSGQLATLSVTVPAANTAMLQSLGDLIHMSVSTLRSLSVHAVGRVYSHPVTQRPDEAFTTVRKFDWLTDGNNAVEHLPQAKLRRLELLNLCACGVGEMEHARLAACFDWGCLQEGSFSCVSLLKLAGKAQLHGLSLRLDNWDERHPRSCAAASQQRLSEVRGFLAAQCRLARLTVRNGAEVLFGQQDGEHDDGNSAVGNDGLLEHLGRTLEELSVSDDDLWHGGRSKPALSGRASSLAMLGQHCRRIRELCIDVPSDDVSFSESLRGMKQHLAFIRGLQLNIEAEKPGHAAFRKVMTRDRAVEVWHDLRSEQDPMRRLERLVIEVGPPVPLDCTDRSDHELHLSKLQRQYSVFPNSSGGNGSMVVARCEEVERTEEKWRHMPGTAPSPQQRMAQGLGMLEQLAKVGLSTMIVQQMISRY